MTERVIDKAARQAELFNGRWRRAGCWAPALVTVPALALDATGRVRMSLGLWPEKALSALARELNRLDVGLLGWSRFDPDPDEPKGLDQWLVELEGMVEACSEELLESREDEIATHRALSLEIARAVGLNALGAFQPPDVAHNELVHALRHKLILWGYVEGLIDV